MENVSLSTEKQHVLLTLEEAQELDRQIVDGASTLQKDLLDIYYGEGYIALGYKNWGNYLDSVSERAGLGRKALYRWHKASLLLDHTPNVGISSIKEGSVRAIIDTLSDRKGFQEDDRVKALELAIEFANGEPDSVTGNMAQTAAWYVAVNETVPDNGAVLAERMKGGEITPMVAYQINNVMLSDGAAGMEHILSELGDADLARYLVNLRHNSKDAYSELEETLVATGYLPTRTDEQIKVDRATLNDVISYLDEPGRLRRQEKAIERTQIYKEIATLAAQVVTEYWGIHPNVPEQLKGMETESKLYSLLLDAGLIRYGMRQ